MPWVPFPKTVPHSPSPPGERKLMLWQCWRHFVQNSSDLIGCLTAVQISFELLPLLITHVASRFFVSFPPLPDRKRVATFMLQLSASLSSCNSVPPCWPQQKSPNIRTEGKPNIRVVHVLAFPKCVIWPKRCIGHVSQLSAHTSNSCSYTRVRMWSVSPRVLTCLNCSLL